jgi:thiol-disulfide isomerase/thioredoxin
MPAFQLLLSNGKTLSTSNLKGKPVLLIYFSSDCDHCITLMNAFFKKANEFKKAEVLLVTFRPLADVVNFEKNYKTSRFAHIRVGAEKTPLYLQRYYKLQNTPFTALFDKTGTLVFSQRKDPSVDELVKRLKQLK